MEKNKTIIYFNERLEKMPTTAQQRGITKSKGKLVFYNRKGTDNVELESIIIKNRPDTCYPKGTPLTLNVIFSFAIKDKKKWGTFKTTKPDNDNMMKKLQDLLTKHHYYADDSQIVRLTVTKFYGEYNSIELEMREI